MEPQSSPAHATESHEQSDAIFFPEAISVELHIPPMNLHPMQTRSKSGITKKKVCYLTASNSSPADLSLLEPSGFKLAMRIPVWHQAM